MRTSFNRRAASHFAAAVLALACPFHSVNAVAAPDAYDAALIRAVAAKERALDVNEPARWEEAVRLFQEANDILATREAEYELGFAAQQLRQTDLAVQAYETALDLDLEGAPRQKAAAFVSEHAESMARLVVRSGPKGARLFVRGVYRGKLPLARPIAVIPGPLRLKVLSDDGNETTRDIALAARMLGTIDLSEPVVPAAPPAMPAPVASPLIAAPAPHPSAPAPPPAPSAIDIATGAAPSPSGSALGWAFIGTGAAAVIAGVALIPVANARIADARSDLGNLCAVPAGSDACANALPGSQSDAQSKVDAIASWKAVRTGAWIGAGAGLAALGAGAFFLSHRPHRAHMVRVLEPSVDVARARAVIFVRGSF